MSKNPNFRKCFQIFQFFPKFPNFFKLVDFWLELMVILMFLTGAGVLDDFMDGLQMPGGSYVKFLLKSNEFEGIKNPLKD